MLRVISLLFIDIVTTSGMLRMLLTGINHNDHTLRSRMKRNLHVRFWTRGGRSDPPADHTGIPQLSGSREAIVDGASQALSVTCFESRARTTALYEATS